MKFPYHRSEQGGEVGQVQLAVGRHTNPAEGVCAMELAAMLAGLDFSDNPSCTSPVISSFVRGLNDNMPDGTRDRLRAYVPRLVGTNAPDIERARVQALAISAINRFAAAALRVTGYRHYARHLERLDLPLAAAEAARRIYPRVSDFHRDDLRETKCRLAAASVYQASKAAGAVYCHLDLTSPLMPDSDVGEWAAFSACNAFNAGADDVWGAALATIDELISIEAKT